MKIRIAALVAAAAFVAACDNSATGPNASEAAALVRFDAQNTMDSASMVPRGPAFDNAGMPDSLKLTDAQKTAIQALHDAFAAAHKTQFDQLKAIHDEAAAAIEAGKSRDDVRAILEKGRPIMESMKTDFEALRIAVAQVLTPAQLVWSVAHQRMGGGMMGGPPFGAPGGMMGRRP
jgi:Spy/CpxP family protein refolding chaperone